MKRIPPRSDSSLSSLYRIVVGEILLSTDNYIDGMHKLKVSQIITFKQIVVWSQFSVSWGLRSIW